MFKEYKWEILLIFVIVAAVGVGLGYFIEQQGGPGPMQVKEDGLPVGEVAPPIQASAWVNGPPPSMEALEGQVYVVDIWASWCFPCKMKAPELVETYNKYKDRVQFIGLTFEGEDQIEEINEFISENGIEWPNGYGTKAEETVIAYQSQFIPEFFVIGRDGKVVFNHNSQGTLADGIELALKQGESGGAPETGEPAAATTSDKTAAQPATTVQE